MKPVRNDNYKIPESTHAKISRVLQIRRINLNEARYGTSARAIAARESIKAILRYDNIDGRTQDKYLDIMRVREGARAYDL